MENDLTKLVATSDNPCYKNNDVYVGSSNITGSTSAGVNRRSITVPLNEAPDLCDILFKGASQNAVGERPSTGWFLDSYVTVIGNDAGAGYINEPTQWKLNSKIDGSNLVISAEYTQTFIATLALTSTPFSYRLVDYSAFLD